MKRKTFDTETWIGQGEALLKLGLNVSKENTIHHETMNTIALNLPLLRKALNAGKNDKAEKITNELNSLNSDIDDKVWKIWSTRIRVKKNNEKKNTVRLENESLTYVKDYSKAKKTTVNSLLKDLNHEYFFVEKSQKKYLDSFIELTVEEKTLFNFICRKLVNCIKEKEKIDLTKIALEARGEIPVRGNIYQFGSLNHKIEPTVNYTKKPLKKVLQQGSIIYLVEPLPRRILRLLVLLRQRYLN